MAHPQSDKDTVASVLVKVQDDLGKLKSSLGKFIVVDGNTALNFEALDHAISKTKESIRKHAEEHLKTVNTELKVLPLIEEFPVKILSVPHWQSPSKTVDVTRSSPSTGKKLHVHSPGTSHRKVRQHIPKKYGASLPKIKEGTHLAKHEKPCPSGLRFPPLPKDNTKTAVQPQMLSLLLHQKPVRLHPRTEYKTGPGAKDLVKEKSIFSKPFYVRKEQEVEEFGPTKPPPPSAISKSPPQSVTVLSTTDVTIESTPSPFEDTSTDEITLVIKNGQMDTRTIEFGQLIMKFPLCRNNMIDHLDALQDLMRKYAVPVAIVRGRLLAELSSDLEDGWEKSPPRNVLLSVLDNWKEVSDLISKPGQRFKGEGGVDAAAILIQSYCRRFLDRNSYVYHLQRQAAAETFCIAWLLRAELLYTRRALAERRFIHLEKNGCRLKHLVANWKHIKSSKRTIIHIPSLGYSLSHRRNLRKFNILQNMQIGRLFEIRDKNVAVIYVCPVHLGEEILEYYTKFLNDETDTDEDEELTLDAPSNRRFIILTPEAVDHFPTHNMCLSTLLKYSPNTLKHIKSLIEGKLAYIVGGVAHVDDLAVADELDVPILGTNLDALKDCKSKSDVRRIFADAEIDFPPGKEDIRSMRQLYETMAELLVNHIVVERWVFKINLEPGAWAKAYCDSVQLSSYDWAVWRYRHYGADAWNTKSNRTSVRIKFLEEIPEWLGHNGRPVKTSKYPNWGSFLRNFLKRGGVIEAAPSSSNATYLTVDMLLEPGGEVTMLSFGDQLYGSCQLEPLGATIPQTSVHPTTLHSLCMRLGETLLQRDIFGYVSLDLVTFLDSDTMNQKVWAVGLEIAYSNHLAMTQILLMLTRGSLNWHTGCLEVPVPENEKTSTPSKTPVVNNYGVIGTDLYHSNLFMLYHNSFLHICRNHLIGFSFKKRRGSVLTFFDINDRCNIGMLTISEDPKGALMTFDRNLSVIHQELTSRNKGETNFMDLAMNIGAILHGTTSEETIDE